jgi:hypothetical protein
MENTKTTTTFLGRINGVTYNTPEAFQEALENLKNGTATVCPKCGKPECSCSAEIPVEYIERPAIYATDIDYIVPSHSEFKTEMLPTQWNDVNSKLERRMAYFVQQVNLNQLSAFDLDQIQEKCKFNAESMRYKIEKLQQTIEFLNRRRYETTPIEKEVNYIGEIIGFYHAMADNAKDEIGRFGQNIGAEKDKTEETCEAIQELLSKLPQDKLGSVLDILKHIAH